MSQELSLQEMLQEDKGQLEAIITIASQKGWIDKIDTKENECIMKLITKALILSTIKGDLKDDEKLEIQSLELEAQKQLLLLLINAKIPFEELTQWLGTEEVVEEITIEKTVE